MKPTLMIAPLVVFATVALAAPNKDTSQIALELGTVIAAEKFCGLQYDHQKIVSFIERNVPADDMGFASRLQLMTAGKQFDQKRMTGAAKAAHCAQVTRAARANGFVP